LDETKERSRVKKINFTIGPNLKGKLSLEGNHLEKGMSITDPCKNNGHRKF
jgi:hypothetical protein